MQDRAHTAQCSAVTMRRKESGAQDVGTFLATIGSNGPRPQGWRGASGSGATCLEAPLFGPPESHTVLSVLRLGGGGCMCGAGMRPFIRWVLLLRAPTHIPGRLAMLVLTAPDTGVLQMGNSGSLPADISC